MEGVSMEAHLSDFTMRFDDVVDVAQELRRELEVAWALYVEEAERLARQALRKTG
jgi:hypothetical protein